MTWRGKVANVIGCIGLALFIVGICIGSSPDDFYDVWMIAIGGCLMGVGCAVDDAKVR